jgi:general secretion pathway protein D
VILKVKPVIHSNDRVDLEVSQEVSAAESTLTGVNNSPTFGKRKIETRLSLKNGATVLLGGLISSTGSDGSAGVPLLKDIPLLGNLFSNNSFSKTKTELIVLITPYIIADDQDAVDLTTEFRKQLEKIVVPKVSPGAKGRDKEQVEPTRPSTVQ